jgi:hypothetical protein
MPAWLFSAASISAVCQGLTLVHVRAQLEQLQDTFRVKLGYTVDRRAQVELKSVREYAPAVCPEKFSRFGSAPCIRGFTLIHFSAQLKRILWDRGAFKGCSGGV